MRSSTYSVPCLMGSLAALLPEVVPREKEVRYSRATETAPSLTVSLEVVALAPGRYSFSRLPVRMEVALAVAVSEGFRSSGRARPELHRALCEV